CFSARQLPPKQRCHFRPATRGSRCAGVSSRRLDPPSIPSYIPRRRMLSDYIPALIAILFGVGFSAVFVVLAVILWPKRETPAKLQPFECGSEPIGSPRVRFSVKFYQVAILFLVFDIEAAFLYPWAIQYRTPTLFGFIEMLVFLAVLVVALLYVWRKK